MADSNRPPMSQYDQSVAGSSMFANAYNSGLAAGMQCHVTNSDPHKLQWMHPPDTFQYDMDPVLSHLASEGLKELRQDNPHADMKGFKEDKPCMYNCDRCSYQSPYKYHVTRHKKIHVDKNSVELFCETCDYTTFNPTNLAAHNRTHTREKTHACHLCDYKGSYKAFLESHMITHSNDKPYKCEMCSFRTARKSHLTAHIKTHSGLKPHACNLCDYKGMLLKHLVSHVRIVHLKEKPFKCPLCHYRATTNSNLKSHIRTHTGEKQYQCVLCNHQCTAKKYLISHMKRKHLKKDKIKKSEFCCVFCDYTCTAKRYLVAHLKKKHSSEALDPALEDEEGLEEDEEDVKSDDEEDLEEGSDKEDGEVAGPSNAHQATRHSSQHDTRHSVAQHVEVKQDEGRPVCDGAEHVCDLCSLMFTDSQSLINHIMIKHSAKDINDMF